MIRLRRLLPLASLPVLLPAVAQAHPGHEGDELTWDFHHLAAHPVATLGCFTVLAGAAWVTYLVASRNSPTLRRQTFRVRSGEKR